jgi:exodeoxyribonuclease VII large subunit
VIILARGGGSLEDLWPFNDEKLALAIIESGIPVISAVGHETDFSISDFVADMRAPTPSAAAEIVMPEKRILQEGLSSLEKRLSASLMHRLEREREKLLRFSNARSIQRPLENVNQKRQQLDILERNLIRQNRIHLDQFKSELKTAAGRLDALSPLTVLSRGYTVAQREDGSVIRTSRDLKPGDRLILTVTDGKFQGIYEKPL